MDLDLKAAASLIGPNATLRLRDVAGHTLLAVGGRLWITQAGDAQDYFIEAGQRFTVGRDGDTVLQALGGHATVVVLDPPTTPATATQRNVPEGLAAAIDAHAAQVAQERSPATQAGQLPLERIEHEARRLRSAALHHVMGKAVGAIRRGGRALRRQASTGGPAQAAS